MFTGILSPAALIDYLAQVSLPAMALDAVPLILGALLLARAGRDLRDLGAALRRMRVSPPAPAHLLAMSRQRTAEAATLC
ncbi:MAG: hypothetical protein H6741_24850 [Alphaproteobacteria bacterium]|nr:hypothetical protein [Alphaproteobacteria bacterium]MCB9795937.1 hypothetical protein [Alphaproteobacteria bacterium]